MERNNYARSHDAGTRSNIVEIHELWMVRALFGPFDVALDLRLSALRHVVTGAWLVCGAARSSGSALSVT
jgi:hypothetical protein